MRSVQIYIEGEIGSGNYSEIELFNDEKINISLSVQNIQDISKVFTDFSQSFTVPASSVNNAVFKHYYENSIVLDENLIDQRLRRKAYIEIDRALFRTGLIQLEKANIVNSSAESYTITFYGDLVSLKDTFGDAMLGDLDYSSYDHSYSGTEVFNRLVTPNSGTDYDIRYPLISSDRLWSYGDATSTDISITGGRIDFTELYPAIKVPKIFEAIESAFNISFSGLFLTDKRFTNLFLWCKNKSEYVARTNTVTLSNSINVSSYITSHKRLTSSITLSVFNTTSPSVVWFVDVYLDGVFVRNVSGVGNQNINIIGNVNGVVTCNVYGDGVLSFDSTLTHKTILSEFNPAPSGGWESNDNTTIYTNDAVNLTLSSNIANRIPNMKVNDFVSGVLKQFNLTCYPTSATSFQVEPLDDWYQKGAVIDVTNKIDTQSIEVAKLPLYKSINFEYEESKSFYNVQFKDDNGRGYGNLSNNFAFDGGDFNIKLPFENLLHTKIDTNLQVGYSLTEAPDYKSYSPKPCLLYMYDRIASSGFRFFDGTSEQFITNYMPFGQDLLSNGVNYSLNFGADQSSLLDSSIDVYGLYYTYYRNYLENLFNYQNRLTTVKAVFPISLLTSLKLNDRLIIRDKRYTINKINTDITSGEVTLELIHDFREIANENILIVGASSGSVEIPILIPNGVTSSTISTTTTGVTFTGATTFTSDSFATVNYPVNPDLLDIRISESGDTRITQNLFERRSENGTDLFITITQTNTFENGSTSTEDIYLIQEAE